MGRSSDNRHSVGYDSTHEIEIFIENEYLIKKKSLLSRLICAKRENVVFAVPQFRSVSNVG